jgi:hypothetical protein
MVKSTLAAIRDTGVSLLSGERRAVGSEWFIRTQDVTQGILAA